MCEAEVLVFLSGETVQVLGRSAVTHVGQWALGPSS